MIIAFSPMETLPFSSIEKLESKYDSISFFIVNRPQTWNEIWQY